MTVVFSRIGIPSLVGSWGDPFATPRTGRRPRVLGQSGRGCHEAFHFADIPTTSRIYLGRTT
jgi:hypothetical protein